LTDMDGVGVWPNVCSWMRDEPRSRSRSSIAPGGQIQFRPVWLGLWRGAFVGVGGEVTL